MSVVQRAAATAVSLLKLVGRYLLLLFGIWGVGAPIVTGELVWLVGALPLAAYVGLVGYRSYRGVEAEVDATAE